MMFKEQRISTFLLILGSMFVALLTNAESKTDTYTATQKLVISSKPLDSNDISEAYQQTAVRIALAPETRKRLLYTCAIEAESHSEDFFKHYPNKTAYEILEENLKTYITEDKRIILEFRHKDKDTAKVMSFDFARIFASEVREMSSEIEKLYRNTLKKLYDFCLETKHAKLSGKPLPQLAKEKFQQWQMIIEEARKNPPMLSLKAVPN